MKYPLCGYILGVLTHTTALDRLWGGDETLTMVLKLNIRTLASPRQQQSNWGLRVIQNAYFSLLTHTKQLLLVTFCDTIAGIGVSFLTHTWTDRCTEVASYLMISLKSNSRACILDYLYGML